MAKLVFPTARAPYRGFVGEVRGWLSRIATYADKSPGAQSTLLSQIAVLVARLGAQIIAPGGTLALRNYLGAAYTPARTVTVATGGVNMAANSLPLVSGTKVTAPAITGTYVNGYTFTIVNGAITAIVAS